jgi:hypothetical protein
MRQHIATGRTCRSPRSQSGRGQLVATAAPSTHGGTIHRTQETAAITPTPPVRWIHSSRALRKRRNSSQKWAGDGIGNIATGIRSPRLRARFPRARRPMVRSTWPETPGNGALTRTPHPTLRRRAEWKTAARTRSAEGPGLLPSEPAQAPAAVWGTHRPSIWDSVPYCGRRHLPNPVTRNANPTPSPIAFLAREDIPNISSKRRRAGPKARPSPSVNYCSLEATASRGGKAAD